MTPDGVGVALDPTPIRPGELLLEPLDPHATAPRANAKVATRARPMPRRATLRASVPPSNGRGTPRLAPVSCTFPPSRNLLEHRRSSRAGPVDSVRNWRLRLASRPSGDNSVTTADGRSTLSTLRLVTEGVRV